MPRADQTARDDLVRRSVHIGAKELTIRRRCIDVRKRGPVHVAAIAREPAGGRRGRHQDVDANERRAVDRLKLIAVEKKEVIGARDETEGRARKVDPIAMATPLPPSPPDRTASCRSSSRMKADSRCSFRSRNRSRGSRRNSTSRNRSRFCRCPRSRWSLRHRRYHRSRRHSLARWIDDVRVWSRCGRRRVAPVRAHGAPHPTLVALKLAVAAAAETTLFDEGGMRCGLGRAVRSAVPVRAGTTWDRDRSPTAIAVRHARMAGRSARGAPASKRAECFGRPCGIMTAMSEVRRFERANR